MDKPNTYLRSNAQIRGELTDGVRLVLDLAAWAGLPQVPEHWWVRRLRQRVDEFCGTREQLPPSMT